VGRTGSSVVDYVIATQNLFPFVNHFEVHEPNLLSDHCVVDFAFCFTKDFTCTDRNTLNVKSVWNKDYVHSYQTSLASDIVKDKLNNLQYCIESCVNGQDIDTCIYFSIKRYNR